MKNVRETVFFIRVFFSYTTDELQFTALCAQRCAVCQNFDPKIRREHLKFFYEHPDYESEDEIAYFGLSRKTKKKRILSVKC